MAKKTELELAIKIAGQIDPSLYKAIGNAQGKISSLALGLQNTAKVIGRGVVAAAGLAATGFASAIKEAVERVRERGKEDVESAEELLQNHLSEYEKERIEIEKSDETIDPAVLERATGRIVERICTVDAFGA